MRLAIKEYFEPLVPILIITWAVFGIARFMGVIKLMGKIGKPVIILLSLVITLYPFARLSLSEYLLSLNPNYSVGSMAFLLIILWKQFGWKPLLSNKDLLWFSIWNVVVSLCLFSSYLGFIGFDMYSFGYGFSVWFVITALLTIILFLLRSPLSYIFIAYIAAFDLKLLYSNNFFDYITDSLIFLTSIVIVISSTIKSIVIKYRKT